ncbi:MAG TPA: TetR/AcrR family transcriptional regulator [Puia sp.]|nr:TetR/AcrR family transcriptional regulator [Puia sp.]
MEKKPEDLSTEEKIKEAARKIFTRKGYSATRTRDIAEEAGINLALLNYYFRSKEKLFDIVMLENFGQFVSGIRALFNEKTTTLEQKIESLVEFYITQLSANPDLPLFILNEIRSDPKKLRSRGFNKDILLKSHFMQQLTEELKKRKKTAINPMHFVMNIFSMTIFPFLAAPLVMETGNLTDPDFKKIMEERKKLIPVWIKTMLSGH